MRMRSAAITAAGAAVVVLAVTVAVVGCSSAARPGAGNSPPHTRSGSRPDLRAGSPQDTLTGVSCASTTACTAVGATYYGHHVAPVVLRWNGLIWSVQHAPNPPAHGGSTLRAVSCSRPDDCIAVGVRGGQNGTLAEHWNGKTWSVTPTPLSHLQPGELSELNAVSCSSPTPCTAVGDGLAATPPAKQVTVAMRWNGKTWARQPTPNSPAAENELSSVSCPTATACTAIGSQGSVVGSRQSAILAAHWDGRAWKLQPVPAPSGGPGRMHAVACASATYCVAAGVNYAAAVNPPQPGGGRQWPVSVVWAGSTWKPAPVPHPQKDAEGAYLFGVDCSAATACTAVGVYTPTTAQGGPTMADRWNGTSWTLQHSATPPGDTADLTSVSCPARRVCIAVGNSGKNAVPEHMLAERWNGSAWALTPTP